MFLFTMFRFTNKVSESYLSATLSTTERHFGFKTKEMSLVSFLLYESKAK